MSEININVPVTISTRVLIRDGDTKKVLVDKSNAIHRANMARVLGRGLAHEPNYFIYRMAFGNGGTFRDAAGNLVYNPPNDGRDGSTESRLYHETYSEVVDDQSPFKGTDPGSAEPGNIRPGGGSDKENDPVGTGVTSQEVGSKTNVTVKCYLNNSEPAGQSDTIYGPAVIPDPDDRCFLFDEIGLYSYGAPATKSHGYSSLRTGNATSESPTVLLPNRTYTLSLDVDGNTLAATILTPAGGTGASGELTYGDVCEGINTGAWVQSGDQIKDYVLVYITDRSGGTYPTIIGKQSYGHLIFESKTVGTDSTVTLNCAGAAGNFFSAINDGNCNTVNEYKADGQNAGVSNDPANPENERERLLTHLIFDPIHKSSHRSLEIEYILTISVAQTTDSQVQINK